MSKRCPFSWLSFFNAVENLQGRISVSSTENELAWLAIDSFLVTEEKLFENKGQKYEIRGQ